jgi:uncharacterized protein (TIGR03067 family)
MNVRVLAVLFVGSMLAVGASGQEKGKADKDKIEGAWSPVALEREGVKAPQDSFKNLKVTFADGKVKITGTGNDKVTDISYTLDPTKKPKEIDFTDFTKGGDAKGIYELDGDNLKMCVDDTPTRPTDFTTQAGSSRKLFVLKRDKK